MKTPLAAEAAIAIVDDDDLVRGSLASLFRSFGVRVEAFSSAASFLSGGSDRFDLVVSDLHMPGIDGLELRRILGKRELSVPVIIITAYPERAADLSRAGQDPDLFEKPVDSARLIARVEKILGRPIG